MEEMMMGTIPMEKLLTKMSMPLIVSMLIQALYNIVDGIFVGKSSLEAMTALGMAFPIQLLMMSLATGIGVGMSYWVSRLFGEGKRDEVQQYEGSAVRLSILLGIVFAVLAGIGSDRYSNLYVVSMAIRRMCSEYLLICCTGAVGLFLAIIGQRFLQVRGLSALSMIAQISGAVFNCIVDPILIFGLFGCPKMGVTGAALATISGQALSAIVSFCFLIWKTDFKIQLRNLQWNSTIWEITKVGLPAALSMAMNFVMSFGMNIIYSSSTIDVSMFTIYYRLWCFLIMPIQGLLQGLIPIMGYNYGAHNKERIRKALKLSLIASVLFMGGGTIVFLLFAKQLLLLFLPAAYYADTAFIYYGIYILRLLSITFVCCGLGTVLSNVFQGLGNSMPGLLHAFLHQGLLLLLPAWIIVRQSQVQYVWFAFLIAEIGAFAVIGVMFCPLWKKIMEY